MSWGAIDEGPASEIPSVGTATTPGVRVICGQVHGEGLGLDNAELVVLVGFFSEARIHGHESLCVRTGAMRVSENGCSRNCLKIPDSLHTGTSMSRQEGQSGQFCLRLGIIER